MSAPIQRGFDIASKAWGLLSAVGLALYFGVGWLVQTNDVVHRQYPAHVDVEADRGAQLAETQQKVAAVLESIQERELDRQMTMELECEDEETTLPDDYCQGVLKEKRLRERRERMGAKR